MKKKKSLDVTNFWMVTEMRLAKESAENIVRFIVDAYFGNLNEYEELFYRHPDGREFHIYSKTVIIEQKVLEL